MRFLPSSPFARYTALTLLSLGLSPVAQAAPQALDVARRERTLRRECATLARDLAFALDAPARPVSARDVHRIAKERVAKAQGDLSLGELERKKLWLERSIKAGRMV